MSKPQSLRKRSLELPEHCKRVKNVPRIAVLAFARIARLGAQGAKRAARGRFARNSWKILVAVIAFFVAAVSLVDRLGIDVADVIERVFYSTPRITLRSQSFSEVSNGRGEFLLKFSVVNRYDAPIVLNGMDFVEAPVEWNPPTSLGAQEVEVRADRVSIGRIRFASVIGGTSRVELFDPPWQTKGLAGRFANAAGERAGARSHLIFLKNSRLKLEPREPLDFMLYVDVEWPSDIEDPWPPNAYVPASIELNWEDHHGVPADIRTPVKLTFPFPIEHAKTR